ncbi:hypothetical protein MMC26_001445 [Xylographa opegraphella]|nr:hypothetical protein [Xylographa opegraphella]
MAKKRKTTSSTSEGPYNKRPRAFASNLEDGDINTSPYNIQSRVDPTYGQRGAFPGLDVSSGEDELFQGPANDGMEYLRLVRSEARGVPNLLVAPSFNEKKADTEDGDLYEDYETGYYEDGAYTALPDLSSTSMVRDYVNEEDEDIDPQEAYYASLSNRFREIRLILHSSPPAPSLDKPHNDNLSASTQAAFLHNATHREWRYQILHTTPSMRLLASMHQDGVVRGLSRLETLLPKKDLLSEIQGNQIGAWCWGLLGRCREIGEMGSEEVGVLRTLGKTALRMGKKLKMQKHGGLGVRWNTEADAAGDNDDEGDDEESEEVPPEVVTGAEKLEEHEVRNGEIEEEIEEGEVDETENVAEPTKASEDNRNGDVSVMESEEQNAQAVERWPEHDTSMETAPGKEVISNAAHNSRSFDALAQYEHVKDSLSLAKELLLAQVRSPAPSATAHGADHALEDNSNDKGSDVEAKALATLDMIVTIVGEFYGQKDLLNARTVWGE